MPTPLRSLSAIATECMLQGVHCSIVEAFSKGGAGAADLAQKVVEAIERQSIA